MIKTAGRRTSGYQVESVDGQVCHLIPNLIKCSDIPDNRSEIPAPDMALPYLHLKIIAHLIPIMFLLGRDPIRHADKSTDPHNATYAQKLDLGNVCEGKIHKPLTVNAFYTNDLERAHPTFFESPTNIFQLW